ncbi:probable aspartyl protease At4g16563 [Cornus florida]|uniref:probable aspartyl protease At4g16563 n=1 Tax=Cornus florida TaxID=4283 RepID=UPI0028A20B3B|nr:probable aspartyl protease At4g16563 [Cornus florida]
MDTNSDFNWFPFTHRYLCKNCSFSASDPPIIPSFIPKLSSSSKILNCENPKCGWIHNPDARSRCQDCEPSSTNCTEICPPYLILYGSGTTGGITPVETLDLPGKKVLDFVVGCSLFSSRQPAGISGFGRGSASLPSQLGLKNLTTAVKAACSCWTASQIPATGPIMSATPRSLKSSGRRETGIFSILLRRTEKDHRLA